MKISNRHLILLILLLAAFLRLPNLETIPFWEADEGYNLNYAWNLSEGRMLWFSIKYPFVPHPPLFYIILAGLIKIFGYTLYPARLFAVLLDFGIILLLYGIGTRLAGRKAGLVASFLYAIYPHAIFWGRMNYNNNLLALMIAASLYMYLLSGRWKILSYIVIGLSVIVEFNGVSLVITAFLLSRILDKKDFTRNMLIVLVPGAIFALIMLYLMPAYFIHDLIFQLKRFGFSPAVFITTACFAIIFYLTAGHLPAAYEKALGFLRKEVAIMFSGYGNLDTIVWNNGLLVTLAAAHFYSSRWLLHEFSDGYFLGSFEYYWFALAGLLLIKDSVKRNTALMFAIPVFLVTLKIGRLDHMCIPLYPLFSLAGGILLPELNILLRKVASLFCANETLALTFSTLLLAYPFAFVLYADVDAFVLGNRISHEDVKGMMEAAGYVNARINSTDLVLTTNHLTRYVKGNVAVFIQGVAINRPIEYYSDLPPERFVYNISIRNAKYIVLPENEGLAWLAKDQNGSFRDISDEISGWGVEKGIGPYYIYHNPEK